MGVEHALEVSKLIDAKVLGIPLNQLPSSAGPAKLLMARPGAAPVTFGSLEITIVGPTASELEKLRQGWNNWLNDNPAKVANLNEAIRRSIDEFSQSGDPAALHAWEGIPGFRGVTVPNLASLVLLVEDNDGATALLTGDAQHDLLLEHLEAAGLLASGHRHLDVLKVQHHGADANMSPKFARTVSADHYLFCGDGANGNPEPPVIRQIFDSRMSGDPAVRATAPEAADQRPFHFWFSTSSTSGTANAQDRADFRATEREVRGMKRRSRGRLKTHFNNGTSISLAV